MENFNDDVDFKNETPDPRKRSILIGIIICVVLIVVLTLLVLYFREVDKRTFKLYIDDTKVSVADDFYVEDEDGNIYVKAKDLANYIGWTYQNGEYGSYTEDSDSGYVQNEYEASSFVSGSNIIQKYIIYDNTIEVEETATEESEEETLTSITVNSAIGTQETIELGLPILTYNDLIYFPFEYINDICNCDYSYSENRMRIYEWQYLLSEAQQNAAAFGYTAVSGVYENIRALAYGMMVVQNSSEELGVVSLYSSSADPILGFKYIDITFNQNTKEFLVKTSNSRVGIIDINGETVISPTNYDNITLLDDTLNLYLIEKDRKYGIMDRSGFVIVYPDYTSIGLSDEANYVFSNDENNNGYFIYDNTIVVELDGKYGFYNLNGSNKLKVNYQGIGYITSSDSAEYLEYIEEESNSNNEDETDEYLEGDSVLTIDVEFDVDGKTAAVKGIIVEQTGLNGETLYGIYDAIQEKLIIPCACSRIYSISKNGNIDYYLEYNGESYEFTDYAISHPNDGLYTFLDEEDDVPPDITVDDE